MLSECLKKYYNIDIKPSTLRTWLIKNKLQGTFRKRKAYRQKRERKEYFGQMLQIDVHKWFGDTKTCLLNLIDDATNVNELLFDKQETMDCACRVLWNWIKKYGIPLSIYCDRRNMYVSNKYYEELNNPNGLFRQMCNNLNIKVIIANSPQAKGRVERSNKTHQDRLVKLMKLHNIDTIEKANEYLHKEYIKEHNNKFALPILLNNHISLKDFVFYGTNNIKIRGDKLNIDDICYTEEIRKLNNDWTVSYKGKWYQLKKQSIYNPPVKSSIFIKKTINNKIKIFYRNISIKYSVIE